MLAENEEVAEFFNLIREELKHFFRNHSKFVSMLHFTDQKVFTVASPSARFDFVIPKEKSRYLVR